MKQASCRRFATLPVFSVIHRRHALGLLAAASFAPLESFANVSYQRNEFRDELAKRFFDLGTEGTFVGYKVDDYLIVASDKIRSGEDRLPVILDALWDTHQGDLFDATLELWVAARTDPELRGGLLVLERDVLRRSMAAATEALPDRAVRPGFRHDVEFALAAIRGLALLRAASGGSRAGAQRQWPPVRERLLRALA